jgi:uncharacterized iron-regulated protein
MSTLRMSLALILAFAVSCTFCGAQEINRDSFKLLASESQASARPVMVDPDNQKQLDELTAQLVKKRALFIGEIHDQLEHHQNQLRVIKSLYTRFPDFAIGLEYFQQPFQKYLDDYIAGRIDEREMLVRTEYFKRWQVDYRLLQPILAFAREKHIPLLALNVPDEIHNKVFRGGMKSLTPLELAQIPADILPASEHYLQRLKTIFDSHPPKTEFGNFVAGVLLWDETMADNAAHYLKSHPQSRVVVLAGMVHVMYGEGIPDRVDRNLGGDLSVVMLNGSAFADYPGVADYQLTTVGGKVLPKAGKMGVSIMDSPGGDRSGGVRVSEFTPDSAAQAAGIAIGDRIVALNGMKVASISELKSIMFDKHPGEPIQVLVERDHSIDTGKELQFDILLR